MFSLKSSFICSNCKFRSSIVDIIPDLTARYNQTYYNSYLSADSKSKLAETKTRLDNNYSAVIDLINKALENNSVTDAELEAIIYAMSDYKVQVGVMSELLESCIDEISEAKVSGVSVGGRNLIINSTFNDGLWSGTGWRLVEDNFTNSAVADQKGLLSDNVLTITSPKFIVYNDDSSFTFSCNIRVADFDLWDEKVLFTISFYGGENHSEVLQSKTVYLDDVGLVTLSDNQWYRVHYTCKLHDSKTLDIKDSSKAVTRGAMSLTLFRNGNIEVKECKAERGTLPTEWSPAPEDDFSAILSLSARVTDAEQIITEDAIINMVTSSEQFNLAFEGNVTVDDLRNYITNAEVKAQIDGLETKFSQDITDYLSDYTTTTQLKTLKDEIVGDFSHAGGVNLIKNSVGYDGLEFWTKTLTGTVEPISGRLDLEEHGPGSGFHFVNNAQIAQDFYCWIGDFTVHCIVKKGVGGTGYFRVKDSSGAIISTVTIESREYDFERISIIVKDYAIDVNNPFATLEIGSNDGCDMIVTSIMAHFGKNPLQWTHATGEIYNDNIIMNRNGIKVVSSAYEGYTSITPQEFAGYAKVVDEDTGVEDTVKVFCLNKDVTEVSKLQADKAIILDPIKIVRVKDRGIAFVSMLNN